jgi:hypothetical protein
MGRCHEFGSQIREGCGHPMRAGERACSCPECGVVCQGQFDGCPGVWARGPRPIAITVAPAIEAPRVRALAAGPEPAASPPAPAATVNGNGSTGNHAGNAGYAPPPPPRAEPGHSGGSRTEILQWFENAFDELRNELHALASTVARQQAMVAELLDSREAELRVVMVAESLPELVGEAAAKALSDQSDGLAEVVADSLDDLRATVAAADLSSVAVMDGMRELLQRVELTAEINADDARLEGAARLDSLKASVGRQLRPVSAAIAEIADYVAAAEERELARTRALKASVTRQIQPLAAAVEEAMDRSDQQLAEIRARLDALGAPTVRGTKVAPRKATKAAPAKRAKPKPKPKAPAPEPEAGPDLVFDYEELPAAAPPPAPLLLNRRRAGARPKGSGPLAGA